MTLKSSHELKQLKSRLTKLEVELKEAKEVLADNTRFYQDLRQTKETLQERIKELESGSKNLVVSEHALLRYFERVLGFDLEVIKNDILTDTVKARWSSLGNGKYPIQDGRAVIKDSVVVTIE